MAAQADPHAPAFTPEQLAEVRRLQGLYPDRRGALLPVLHLAQDAFGGNGSSPAGWAGASGPSGPSGATGTGVSPPRATICLPSG